jgi:2-amino-4-hydroxy-6-hydroxymethyldihydropteridine diphosphokinase
MPEVHVGAGSNADPVRALQRAVAELEREFGAVTCSRVYRSAAVGLPAAPYLNLVVALSTQRDADSVRETLRAIETLAGRTRADPAVCELDLDLLLYGAAVDASRRLPRPGLLAMPYVLGPLAELVPELEHPVTGERLGAAWRAADRGELDCRGALDSLR